MIVHGVAIAQVGRTRTLLSRDSDHVTPGAALTSARILSTTCGASFIILAVTHFISDDALARVADLSYMACMPSIHAAIAERRTRLSEIEQEVVRIRDDISALIKAAAIMGVSIDDDQPRDERVTDGARRGGKPPGAISLKWREILSDLLPVGVERTLSDIQHTARSRGLDVEAGSIKDRMRRFIGQGYMQKVGEASYSVTAEAVSRFDLTAPQIETAPTRLEDAV